MEKNHINNENLDINNLNINELIDLFYEQMNNKKPLDSVTTCVKIANKIRKDKKEYSEEEYLLFLELRNLYVFCMAQYNEIMMHLKYESNIGLSAQDIESRFHLGFDLISKKTGYDSDVRSFIADNMLLDMINDKFPNHEINLTDEIHKSFLTKDSLEKNGINKSVIDVVSKHDPDLGEFLSCNINILDKYKEEINSIKDDFDHYEEANEKRRYSFLVEDVKEFCTNNNMKTEENLFMLCAEYHILNKVLEHVDGYSYTDYNKIKELVISASREDEDINYYKLKRIVERYLNERIIKERFSILDKKSIKNKIDTFLEDFNNMTLEEQVTRFNEILESTNTNEEYDYAMEYIVSKASSFRKNILSFKKEIN